MKEVHGWYLPDDDVHFTQYLDGLKKAGHPVEYQQAQRDAAIKHCDKFRKAIDIGAHVGLWTLPLTARFDRVIAFEPHEPFIEILCKQAPSAEVHPTALGGNNDTKSMSVNADNSGIAYIDDSGTAGSVSVTLLDYFGFSDIDLIKIDCEGYEFPILQGANETLRNNDAVIIVEQKPHKTDQYTWGQYSAVEYLISVHGYRVVDRVVDDWILKKLPKKGV
jgi:FkbM family methyltransferase